ncbi:cache domain-containing protein, partial [Helicobacter burdigaliensis]|uniref:cache domain-containing protein n=2 Tax=Helicobacter burdigaliensis TaxID=2315334 RepID=UPI0039EA3D8D
MNSIKIKVSLIANFIAIICLLILGIVTFIYVKQIVLDETIKEETNYIKMANSLVLGFDRNNQETIRRIQNEILAKQNADVFGSIESLQLEFDNVLHEIRNSLGLLGVYIAHPSGEIVVSNGSSDAINANSMIFGKKQNYDARTREWYLGASKLPENQIYTSDSYVDVASGEHVFTYAMPIYKENKLVGVLGIDVLASTLQEQIQSTPGRVFAFDTNTQVFASNDPTLIASKEGEINPAIKTVAEL